MSDFDRGSFPHDPATVGDMPSWDPGWGRVRSGKASKPNHFRRYVHPTRQSEKNISIGMYISHGDSEKKISIRMYITHSQSKEYVSVLMYIPHGQSRENVSVRMYIPHSFMYALVCERCNYHTRSASVNCLLSLTTSHTI